MNKVRKFLYNKLILFVLICLWFFIQSNSVFACRYNVREAGFIDLGNNTYSLYLYVNNDTPEEITSSFNQISNTTLFDCNIRGEMINADLQKDHPAMKYLLKWQIQSFPTVIFVSPNGQSFVVTLKKNVPFEKALLLAINDIVISPIREEIIKKVIETYGVVLLIEGDNAQENKKYRDAALYAIENIRKQLKMMPKIIDYPPVLISLKPELFSQEKFLLWSLGLDAEDINTPYAAVFYGKARWVGPLMKAEEISKTNLIKILSVIGLDCECELDLSWVSGTILPIKWDQNRQAKVAKLLGFDPENPMIKMEVSQILNKGSSTYPGVPVAYKESSRKTNVRSDIYVIDENKSSLDVLLYSIGGFLFITVIIGLFIFIKAKRKNI